MLAILTYFYIFLFLKRLIGLKNKTTVHECTVVDRYRKGYSKNQQAHSKTVREQSLPEQDLGKNYYSS
jgi:hypothetical protein